MSKTNKAKAVDGWEAFMERCNKMLTPIHSRSINRSVSRSAKLPGLTAAELDELYAQHN